MKCGDVFEIVGYKFIVIAVNKNNKNWAVSFTGDRFGYIDSTISKMTPLFNILDRIPKDMFLPRSLCCLHTERPRRSGYFKSTSKD